MWGMPVSTRHSVNVSFPSLVVGKEGLRVQGLALGNPKRALEVESGLGGLSQWAETLISGFSSTWTLLPVPGRG